MSPPSRPLLLLAAAAALALRAASAESASCGADGVCTSPLILVASATATTGAQAVAALSAAGARVRAMVRKLDDPRAAPLKALPGVELVAGDFDDAASVAAALSGTQRALLVSGAFAYEQFERESLFCEAAAAAGLEVVVRVGTGSFLTKAGTKGAYGRAHHGVEAFVASMGYPHITLHPNWFTSNWLGNAAEAKASGTITLPVRGDGPRRFAFIDPRDVGGAAAAVLMLPSPDLRPLIAKAHLELHGPAAVNFVDVAAALSGAVGYPIKINTVDRDAWANVLVGYGIPRVFATSFLETVEQIDGVVPRGYPADTVSSTPMMTETSPELLKFYQPRFTIADWAEANKAAFAK